MLFRSNLRPLCSSIRVSTAVISAAREAPPGLLTLDKASAPGAGDSRLESWADQVQGNGLVSKPQMLEEPSSSPRPDAESVPS